MLGGNDRVFAGGACDTVYGGSGRNEICGEHDTDKLHGGRGNDSTEASFNDTAGSTNRTSGGDRNDFIVNAFGNKDIIDCGKGADDVKYDQGLDTLKSCKTKHPRR